MKTTERGASLAETDQELDTLLEAGVCTYMSTCKSPATTIVSVSVDGVAKPLRHLRCGAHLLKLAIIHDWIKTERITPRAPAIKKCICDMMALMRVGCKCGGK